MCTKRKNRIAQLILLTAWVSTLALNYPVFVSSQECIHPKYMHQPIHVNSWFPGTEVTVQIDTFFEDNQEDGLRRGNERWNHSTIGCSGVKFLHYDVTFYQSYTETPPPGELWWQSDDPQNGGFNAGVFAEIAFGGFVESARIKIHPNAPNVAQGTFYDYLGTHEVGHTFNLQDCVSTTGCNGTEDTIMRGHSDGITTPNSFNTGGPKACDLMKVRSIYCTAATPTPTPTPPPSAPIGCSVSPDFFGNCPSGYTNNGCGACCSDAERNACINMGYMWNADGGGYCRDPNSVCFEQQYECMVPGQFWNMYACACTGVCAPSSPILVDVSGNGFKLTDNAGGVFFDLNGDGARERLSWTDAGDDDAWLVFDRDGDGVISKGAELFGNFTYQSETRAWERHGFFALAEFDKQASGLNGGYSGNGDGLINRDDAVFSNLRLWQDTNHNGISEASELHPLPELGLHSIALAYTESKRSDQHGNLFRYRAKVRDQRGAQLGRWAWDVFLLRAP